MKAKSVTNGGEFSHKPAPRQRSELGSICQPLVLIEMVLSKQQQRAGRFFRESFDSVYHEAEHYWLPDLIPATIPLSAVLDGRVIHSQPRLVACSIGQLHVAR